MNIKKNGIRKILEPIGSDFFELLWEESWTYIKTVVDVVREPILVLDKDLRVLAANESFYKIFQVKPKDTENKIVYKLGNGQWNIPALRKLLENILPKDTFFKGFEVSHQFPHIGHKVMILNARQIHFKQGYDMQHIILLAIEDITDMMAIAETFAKHANHLEDKFSESKKRMEIYIEKLEIEIKELKMKK